MKSLIKLAVASAFALTAVVGAVQAADKTKIGFLVKQPEEPWFQIEWAFAEKAAKANGFELVKIAAPDGEKTLAAIDTLGAAGAKGFVICPPDVRLGPAVMAKAKQYDLKVITVDDRFVGSDGKFMEDVPHLGLDAFAVGQAQGKFLMEQMKTRGWKAEETGAVVNTYDELDTAKQRTDGSVDSLVKAGFPKDSIFNAPNRTTDVPGSMDATNIVLTQHPEKKNWLIIGMNDSAVLGGIRATEGAGYKAANVAGIGINGTDAVAELEKKEVTGFYGSLLLSPDVHGGKTATMVYEWAAKGVKPPALTPVKDVTLITRENFRQKLKEMGLM